jgi:hypothetical protein
MYRHMIFSVEGTHAAAVVCAHRGGVGFSYSNLRTRRWCVCPKGTGPHQGIYASGLAVCALCVCQREF